MTSQNQTPKWWCGKAAAEERRASTLCHNNNWNKCTKMQSKMLCRGEAGFKRLAKVREKPHSLLVAVPVSRPKKNQVNEKLLLSSNIFVQSRTAMRLARHTGMHRLSCGCWCHNKKALCLAKKQLGLLFCSALVLWLPEMAK